MLDDFNKCRTFLLEEIINRDIPMGENCANLPEVKWRRLRMGTKFSIEYLFFLTDQIKYDHSVRNGFCSDKKPCFYVNLEFKDEIEKIISNYFNFKVPFLKEEGIIEDLWEFNGVCFKWFNIRYGKKD